MPFLARANLSGMRPLLDRLAAFGEKVRKKVTRAMVAAGGRAVAKQAKRRAAKETGLLRRSIGSKVKTYGSGVVVAVVGPRLGFRKQVTRPRNRPHAGAQIADPVKYAHLVELGTSKTVAKPFLAPALADGSVRAAMEAAAVRGIDAAAAGGGA